MTYYRLRVSQQCNSINEFDFKTHVSAQRTHLTYNNDRKCSSWSEKFDNQGNKKFKETKSSRKQTSGAYNLSHESPLAYNLRCTNLTFIRQSFTKRRGTRSMKNVSSLSLVGQPHETRLPAQTYLQCYSFFVSSSPSCLVRSST